MKPVAKRGPAILRRLDHITLRGLANKYLIRPPHRLVPHLVFIAVVISFLVNRHSPFYTFRLADPDDYMRLNEVINWLNGGSWYDLSHPRLDPGAHVVIHWSRIVDIPLALIMWPFLKLWGYRSSSLLASFVEPLVLLGLLLPLVSAIARPLVGRGRAKLATLFVPLVGSLYFNFSPGRVDHHNWEILIAGAGLMALQYMILCRGGWKAGVFSAIAFAIGLWISPEILPALILVLGCLALFAGLHGGFILRNAAVFGGVLAAATAALLPAALPMAQWNEWTISWFSPAYVIFAGLTGAAFILSWALGRHTENRVLRFALVSVSSACAAIFFFYLVPDALGGPFANYDPFDSTTALDSIGEAEPLIRGFHIDPYNHLTWLVTFINFLHYLLPETICLIACMHGFWADPPRRRRLWIVNGICLVGATLMGVFLQYRVLWFAHIFLLGPAAYLVWCFWDRFKERWTNQERAHAALSAFLVLGLAPIFSYMLLRDGNNHDGNAGVPSSCAVKPVTDFIAGPYGYIDRPYTVLTGADQGPEILFRTPHNVLAANFNVPGNKDVFDFFEAHDDAAAIAILRKWHVDLVLTCRHISSFYAGTTHPKVGKNAFLKLGEDNKLHIVSNPTNPPLVEKLVNGPVPKWLKPVEIPTTDDYVLFEVQLPESPHIYRLHPVRIDTSKKK